MRRPEFTQPGTPTNINFQSERQSNPWSLLKNRPNTVQPCVDIPVVVVNQLSLFQRMLSQFCSTWYIDPSDLHIRGLLMQACCDSLQSSCWFAACSHLITDYDYFDNNCSELHVFGPEAKRLSNAIIILYIKTSRQQDIAWVLTLFRKSLT